jgi:hypothetical protein
MWTLNYYLFKKKINKKNYNYLIKLKSNSNKTYHRKNDCFNLNKIKLNENNKTLQEKILNIVFNLVAKQDTTTKFFEKLCNEPLQENFLFLIHSYVFLFALFLKFMFYFLIYKSYK